MRRRRCEHFYLTLLVVFNLTACGSESVRYKTYDILFEKSFPADRQRFYDYWASRQRPALQTSFVGDTGWSLVYGQADESLSSQTPTGAGVMVTLPHRELRPNSALWYRKKIKFAEAGVLHVSADDGAQVFINGVRTPRLKGEFFRIDSAGSVEVTVRVLNNAMEGGLRSVSFASLDQYDQFTHDVDLFDRITLLLEKAILIEKLPDEWNSLFGLVIAHPSAENVKRAEAATVGAPLLYSCVTGTGDKIVLTVLTDSRYPVTASIMAKKRSTVIESVGPIATFELDWKEVAGCRYVIRSGETTTSPVEIFRPDSSKAWSFQVWADSQGGWATFHRLLKGSANGGHAFSIGVGDLVSNGSDSAQWTTLFKVLSTSTPQVPFFLIAGNHDYDGYYDSLFADWYTRYTSNDSATWFRWTYRNAAFIALDVNTTFPINFSDEQREWFFEQIESDDWKKAGWRFVLIHQPPYSDGWPGYEGEEVVRDLLEPVIEKAKIDVVVSGHTHDYERLHRQFGNQTATFWIVGGGGGSLEPQTSLPYRVMDTVLNRHHLGRFVISADSLQFEAFDIERGIMDSYQLVK